MNDTPPTAKWAPLQVPPFCERLIGYSVPTSNRCLVVSYEAVHLLTLDDPVTVQTDEDFAEYDIYDPEPGTAIYSGVTYSIVGLHGGHPMLTTPQGDRLELDRAKQTLTVTAGELITLSAAD